MENELERMIQTIEKRLEMNYEGIGRVGVEDDIPWLVKQLKWYVMKNDELVTSMNVAARFAMEAPYAE